MSRPATAAHSSSRTHSVESRASRRRNVSATLAGIWVRSCHEPCAISSRVSSRTKNGLPPLRCHSWAMTSVTASVRRRRPARRAIASTSAGARPARASCCAVPASCAQLRRTPRCPGRRRAAAPCWRPGRGPGIPAAAATARPPSAGRRAPRARAGRRPGGRGTGRPLRTSGTGRRAAAAALIGSAGPEAGCSSQPASPRSAVGHAAGPQDLRPRPVRRRAAALPAEPAQDQGSPARPRRSARPAPPSCRCRPRR